MHVDSICLYHGAHAKEGAGVSSLRIVMVVPFQVHDLGCTAVPSLASVSHRGSSRNCPVCSNVRSALHSPLVVAASVADHIIVPGGRFHSGWRRPVCCRMVIPSTCSARERVPYRL